MTKKDGFVTRDVAKVQVHPECLYIVGGVKVMCESSDQSWRLTQLSAGPLPCVYKV